MTPGVPSPDVDSIESAKTVPSPCERKESRAVFQEGTRGCVSQEMPSELSLGGNPWRPKSEEMKAGLVAEQRDQKAKGQETGEVGEEWGHCLVMLNSYLLVSPLYKALKSHTVFLKSCRWGLSQGDQLVPIGLGLPWL